jgi:DNA-binding response OmpR family regulator
MRIVIIEDDLAILEILAEVFQSAGYEVITYEDKNSIKGIIINRPDVVLLDNKLRDGFGYELCRDIKNNDLTKHIPVILTSGYDDLENLAKACGADGYVAKPFDLAALVQMANELAGRRAAKVHKHEDFG